MYQENSYQGVFFICICIEKQEVLCTSLVYMYISAYIVILYHQMSATDVPIVSSEILVFCLKLRFDINLANLLFCIYR